MRELALFKSLLDDDMIDFNSLLIKNYKKLDINEKDIIVLSYLARQEAKGFRSFNPTRIRSKVALERADLDKSLEYLTNKRYLDIRTEVNPKTEKECEMFYLDNIYLKVIDIYSNKALEGSTNFFESIANYFEEIFNKQMTPTDYDVVRNWASEKMFSLDEIKNEMIDASKLGKSTLKYVDSVLLKKALEKRESPLYKETISVINELKNKWKK